MADKIFSVADGLHDELPSINTAKAGRMLITTDRGEMYYEPKDKERIQINPQADWQQNDETANDYIKNRPGGYETTTELLADSAIEFLDYSVSLPNFPSIEVGATYIVTFDNVEYTVIGKYNSFGVYIGNEYYAPWVGNLTTEPFCIYNGEVYISWEETIPCTHNIKINKINIVKIDEKYLDIRNTNIINGSEKGSLRTIGSTEESTSYEIGIYAFAEGVSTKSSGSYSHAEGMNTTASGNSSHAEGNNTTASGSYSHVEGFYTTASNNYSHAEGRSTTASGQTSHAEGQNTTASGYASHTEGQDTTASGNSSHAEGNNTTASGAYSHAEGASTTASGGYSHVEGGNTQSGQKGYVITACEKLTDTTGTYTLSSINGLSTGLAYSLNFNGDISSKIGKILSIDTSTKTVTVDRYLNLPLKSHSYFYIENNSKLGDYEISGRNSHAEGYYTQASGSGSHAEGSNTKALKDYSHAEGSNTKALGNYSHAEGYYTEALGKASHAEGYYTQSGQKGYRVIACEKITDTTGTYTLSSVLGLTSDILMDFKTGIMTPEGELLENLFYSVYLDSSKENCGKIIDIDIDNRKITVDGYPDIALSTSSSNTVNYLTIVDRPDLGDKNISGIYSHAEGELTIASGQDSHAEGYRTTAASTYQHVQGKFNIVDSINKYADIIGNGTSISERSNAYTLDWNGNGWFSGDVYVGSTSGTNRDEGSKKLATENRTDNTFANAIKGSKSGSAILIDDVSPVTHDMSVKISPVPQKNLLNRLIAKAYSSDIDVPTEDFINTYCSKKILFKQGTTYTFSIKSVSGFSGTIAWQPSFYIFDNGSLFISNATSPPVTFSTDFFTSDSNVNEYTCYKNKALWTKNNMIQNSGPWTMTITPVKDFEAVFIVTNGNVTDSTIVTEAQIEVGSTATSYVPYIENPITDLTAVKVSKYGKNLFDIDSIANDIVKKNPTSCEITDFDGKRCLKIGATSTIKYTIQTLIPLYGLRLKAYSTGYSASFMGYTKKDTETSVYYINVSAENEWVNITRYYPGVSQYYTGIQFYKTDVTKPIYIDLDSVMLEASHTATEYEAYKGAEYTPTADGTVNGVTSLYPNTTLTTDTEGVIIDCEYNRDINKAFAELQQAIISLGGNV